jgi:uncharacterized protein (TIGR02452 family)
MSKRTSRGEIAQATLKIVEAGGYAAPSGKWLDLREQLRQCRDGTRVYLPEDLEALPAAATTSNRKPEISITPESTLEAMQRLSKEGSAGKVVVLNFASARNPGGGFLGGSEAQEESLARSSALYASQTLCPDFYAYHRAESDTFYSHRMIVSPGCPVFRNDEGDLLEEPYFPTIITAPAPNAGAVKRNLPDKAHRITTVLRDRAKLLFNLAAHLQTDTLVLGAWGCGVFQNDPATVAAVFAELLDPAISTSWGFRQVVFAILSPSLSSPIFAAFQDRLNPLHLA